MKFSTFLVATALASDEKKSERGERGQYPASTAVGWGQPNTGKVFKIISLISKFFFDFQNSQKSQYTYTKLNISIRTLFRTCNIVDDKPLTSAKSTRFL